MGKIILYHGTQNKIVTPVFGGGNDKHDYGRGFYLTEVLNLAKEWATRINNTGFVNKYSLKLHNLKFGEPFIKGFILFQFPIVFICRYFSDKTFTKIAVENTCTDVWVMNKNVQVLVSSSQSYGSAYKFISIAYKLV